LFAGGGNADRILAAGDRAAAAQDRHDAADDRHDAADDLQNAYRDQLTGTLLRGPGCEQLSQTVDRARRTCEPVVFAFLDVDHLKQANDEGGHSAGDALLRQVGAALRDGLRSYDIIVRYGGDEFVCALPGSRLADAEERVSEVRALLAEALAGASVSYGLAELRSDESVVAVIDRADAEMYRRRRLARAQ